MYERDDILHFVKMLERGLFAKGRHFVDVKSFALEDHKEALKFAAEQAGVGKSTVFVPGASS